MRQLQLTRADFKFLWSLDLAALATQNGDILRLARTDRDWLVELCKAIRNVSSYDVGARLVCAESELATSKFEQANERVGSSTLSFHQARMELPLRIPAKPSDWAEAGGLFSWNLDSVSVGALGGLSVRQSARLRTPATVEQLIPEYHSLINLLRDAMLDILPEALKILRTDNGPLSGVEFVRPDRAALDPFLVAYECLDIDFDVREDGLILDRPIKSLIADDDHECVRQLAALSRMTVTEPEHFDAARLRSFQDADVGNREDEIWIVNSNRMLRSHPDHDEERIRWFYEDVLCLVEMAVQRLASLEYLETWLRSAESTLRHIIASDSSSSPKDIGNVLGDIEGISDLVSQPTSLAAGVRHPFFRKVADQLVLELRIPAVSAQLREGILLFLQVAASAFTYRMAVDSHRVTKTVRWLTWVIAIATIVAVLFSAMALARAGSSNGSRNKSVTTATSR